MTFLDVRLPEDVERGARGGPTWLTFLSTARNGREFRNSSRDNPLHQYDISYGVQEIEDLEDVRALFMIARGRLHSFRFKDWSDYQAQDSQFAVGDGIETSFQLSRNYEFETESFSRIITKPADNVNFEVSVDGSPTVVTTDFLTGIVTFGAPPGVGAILTWSGEFDVPVRFELDELNVALTWEEVGDIPSIILREVDE